MNMTADDYERAARYALNLKPGTVASIFQAMDAAGLPLPVRVMIVAVAFWRNTRISTHHDVQMFARANPVLWTSAINAVDRRIVALRKADDKRSVATLRRFYNFTPAFIPTRAEAGQGGPIKVRLTIDTTNHPARKAGR